MRGLTQKITLFPYTTLFRSVVDHLLIVQRAERRLGGVREPVVRFDLVLHQHQRDGVAVRRKVLAGVDVRRDVRQLRSEEHKSELQSPCKLVCRLLLEKKKIE